MKLINSLLLLLLSNVAVAQGLPTCSGSSIPICQDGAGRVHIYAPITVHGTLNYFGTDESDTVKLSSQGIGNGGVVLCTDTTTQDYRPCNIRGDGITFQYKIEDPDNTPHTFSGRSLSGMKLEGYTGILNVYNNLKPWAAIDFSAGTGLILMHPTNGIYINDATNTYNRVHMWADGTQQWFAYGVTPNYHSGDRYLTIDSNGILRTGPTVP